MPHFVGNQAADGVKLVFIFAIAGVNIHLKMLIDALNRRIATHAEAAIGQIVDIAFFLVVIILGIIFIFVFFVVVILGIVFILVFSFFIVNRIRFIIFFGVNDFFKIILFRIILVSV